MESLSSEIKSKDKRGDFKCFPSLPLELRRGIWKETFVVKGQTVEIEWDVQSEKWVGLIESKPIGFRYIPAMASSLLSLRFPLLTHHFSYVEPKITIVLTLKLPGSRELRG